VAFDERPLLVAVGARNGLVQLIDWASKKEIMTCGDSARVSDVCSCRFGGPSHPNNLYVGTHNGKLDVVDIRLWKTLFSFSGHSMKISCLLLREGEKTLLSGSSDGTIREWNITTGLPLQMFERGGMTVFCMDLFGSIVYFGSDDNLLRCWNLAAP